VTSELPSDHLARAQAIDPSGSFLVQAPAGSGKTELLTDRILALLGTVNRPEEIVAITFMPAFWPSFGPAWAKPPPNHFAFEAGNWRRPLSSVIARRAGTCLNILPV
jgi:hypothetical protein